MMKKEIITLDQFHKFCKINELGFNIEINPNSHSYKIKIYSQKSEEIYEENNVHQNDLDIFIEKWKSYVKNNLKDKKNII